MSEQHLEQPEEKKYPVGQSAAMAGGTFAAMGILDAAAHLGPTGLIVAGIAGLVAWRHGPELLDQVRGVLPLPARAEPTQEEAQGAEQAPKGRSFADWALGRKPEQAEQGDQVNDVFSEDVPEQQLPFDRLTMDEIIEHIQPNSYRVYLGRSVLGEGNKARAVNILRQHLKIIGASQFGKSSMAACILEQIIRTHDREHALISILDLEDKTGRLFANDEHLVTFRMGDQDIKMHARNERQVLEYLGYIVQLMDWRYQKSEVEIEREPLLIVYIEEFIDLKDYFRLNITNARDSRAKEQAQKDYDNLIHYISKLARRGLKARIQLLLCAQVQYRDDDLYEALANITAGMSFCVKPSAAQAAGFRDAELLKRNYKDMIKGQAVAEIGTTKDLLLAPEYDARQKLKALSKGPGEVRESDFSRSPRAAQFEPKQAHFQEVPDLESPESPSSEDEDLPEDRGNVRDFPKIAGLPELEPLDPGPKEYRLSEKEIPEFIAAYKACGNIEKALASIGKGSRYKKHASEIVRALGLRKEA